MKIRIPVDSTVLQRASAIGKDSLLTNTFVDTSISKTKYVTKRPGFLLGIGGVTNGTNYGIYINPNTGTFYYVGGNGQPIIGSPPNYWNSNTSYSISQKVIYKDDTTLSKGNKIYIATNSNTNSIPSSTNTNWGGTAISWSLINTISTSQIVQYLFYDGGTLRYVDALGDMYKNLDFTSSNTNTFISSSNVVGNSVSALFDNLNNRFFYFWNAGSGTFFYYKLDFPYTNWGFQQNPDPNAVDYYDSNNTTIYNNYIYGFPNSLISNGLTRINTNTMLLDLTYTPTGLPSSNSSFKFFQDSSNLYFIDNALNIYKTSDGINWSFFAVLNSTHSYYFNSSATLFNGRIYLVNYDGSGATGSEVFSFVDGGASTSIVKENTNSNTTGYSFLYIKNSNLYKIDLVGNTMKVYKR